VLDQLRSRERFHLVCLLAMGAFAGLSGTAARADEKPNVLVIITDDQRANSMDMMPRTRAIFADRGVTYPNGYVTTPLCCPSRASILSGLYAHNHGVVNDNGRRFDATNTWEHELYDAGYYTGIIGKYLNQVPTKDAPWFTFHRGLPGDQRELNYAAADVETFLQNDDRHDPRPWALVLGSHSPHWPWDVQPLNPLTIPPFDPPTSFEEPHLWDKDPSVLAFALNDYLPGAAQDAYYGQSQEEQAANQEIAGLFDALEAHGEKRRTLAFFISDNGLMWGEHDLLHKRWPYLESVHVPFYVRWPDHLAPGTADPRIAANIDIAPTIFDATGVSPRYRPDGRSLLGGDQRSWLLLELPRGSTEAPVPWSAYVTPSREYIQWADGFVEDYDLASDPYQRVASNAPDLSLALALAPASSCKGSTCP
jgi:arylsulfatase A-like enzyme